MKNHLPLGDSDSHTLPSTGHIRSHNIRTVNRSRQVLRLLQVSLFRFWRKHNLFPTYSPTSLPIGSKEEPRDTAVFSSLFPSGISGFMIPVGSDSFLRASISASLSPKMLFLLEAKKSPEEYALPPFSSAIFKCLGKGQNSVEKNRMLRMAHEADENNVFVIYDHAFGKRGQLNPFSNFGSVQLGFV